MSQAALFADLVPTAGPSYASSRRVAFDFYETPAWQTKALLARIPVSGTVLEPCCGDGAIVRVLELDNRVRRVVTNDLDVAREAHSHRDATDPAMWRTFPRADWVVTNPPFNVASAVVANAVAHARLGVAMLLRLTFAEPTQDRGELLAKYRPALIALPRTRYRPDRSGTDSVTSAWFVFLVGDGVARYGSFRNDTITTEERDRLIAEGDPTWSR